MVSSVMLVLEVGRDGIIESAFQAETAIFTGGIVFPLETIKRSEAGMWIVKLLHFFPKLGDRCVPRLMR